MSEHEDKEPHDAAERDEEVETHVESAPDEQLDDEGKKLLHEVREQTLTDENEELFGSTERAVVVALLARNPLSIDDCEQCT